MALLLPAARCRTAAHCCVVHPRYPSASPGSPPLWLTLPLVSSPETGSTRVTDLMGVMGMVPLLLEVCFLPLRSMPLGLLVVPPEILAEAAVLPVSGVLTGAEILP